MNLKHGHCSLQPSLRTPEYRAWQNMRGRCLNPRNVEFPNYGGRGIVICERWDDFRLFLADMGLRPSRVHSIDRIDNDGNYGPGNCRWTTREVQSRNHRRNHIVFIDDERMTLSDACDRLGMSRPLVFNRLYQGWGLGKALMMPKNPQHPSGSEHRAIHHPRFVTEAVQS